MHLKQYNYLIMLLVALTLSMAATRASGLELVLPVYTKHLQQKDHGSYTEKFQNLAIGLQSTDGRHTDSVILVLRNSQKRKSIYLGRKWNVTRGDFTWSGGIIAAIGGYSIPVILSPVLAVRWKMLQIATTYPAAQLVGAPTDIVNIQIAIPLGD